MAGLSEEFRDYLISLGIVRKPRVAGGVPPMWVDPRNGVPAPGEGQNATEKDDNIVLGAFLNLGGGIPARMMESSIRADTIEVRYRVKTAPLVEGIERQIRGAVLDKFDQWFATERIIATQEWRALTEIDSGEQGFEYLSSYVIWRYA